MIDMFVAFVVILCLKEREKKEQLVEQEDDHPENGLNQTKNINAFLLFNYNHLIFLKKQITFY